MLSIVTKPFTAVSEQLEAPTSLASVAIARCKFDQPLNWPPLFLACPLHREIFPLLITWLIIDRNNSEVDMMMAERWLEFSTSLMCPTKLLYSRFQCHAHYFCICYFIFVRVSKVKYTKKINSRPLTFDISARCTDLWPLKRVISLNS
jgi:hypothetical protein